MNNGELTVKKAMNVIEKVYASVPELQEYCKAAVCIQATIDDAIISMEWMLTQLKWKHRLQLNMEDEKRFRDKDVPWSPEMKKAMEVLERLKQG